VLGRGVLPALTTLERKIELITRIDERFVVVVEPFNAELASVEPDEFAERLLVRELGAKSIVVGQNFRFGRNRAGDLPALARFGSVSDSTCAPSLCTATPAAPTRAPACARRSPRASSRRFSRSSDARIRSRGA
jgi:FAD synthase